MFTVLHLAGPIIALSLQLTSSVPSSTVLRHNARLPLQCLRTWARKAFCSYRDVAMETQPWSVPPTRLPFCSDP